MSSSADLGQALTAFERASAFRNYSLAIDIADNTPVFNLDVMEFEVPPLQYRVRVDKIWLHDRYPIVDSTMHDVAGAVRAIAEGIELDVSDSAMTDWLWTRIGRPVGVD